MLGVFFSSSPWMGLPLCKVSCLLEKLNDSGGYVVFATLLLRCTTVCSKKWALVYFDDNFGKYGPILILFSLSQQENYGVQKLSYFSHLTFIMLPLYLAKQTLNFCAT